MDADLTRTTVWVDGIVQGVGFRWWVQRRADALGLVGSAVNLSDGRVQVDAQGTPGQVGALVAELTGKATSHRPGHVASFLVQRRRPDPSWRSFGVG
ncbi:MAG: acylphosphatase [Propioniciclava sp.]